MENDIEVKRAAVIGELKAALAEIESGAGLTRFVGGHGIQSRVFEFGWDEPSLGIAFRMPCGRLLSDEESQKEDDAEIGAAIRMALLLLSTAGRPGAATRIEVACDDRGPTYAVYAEGGEIEDSGEDWAPLVRRLGAELGVAPESVSIIWP
jgi:hypothetical protein